MNRPRPLSVVVVAATALGVGLAMWWLFGDWTGGSLQADDEEGGYLSPTYLRAEDDPELAKPPRLKPAQPDLGRRPRPGRGPAEPTPPEIVAPPPREAEVPDEVEVVPDRRTHEQREQPKAASGSGHWAGLDWRSGAAGYTDATATREVEVEEGRAWIGTPETWVAGLMRQRGAETYPALLYEAPRHTRKMHHYFIDRFEVKNHDYFRHLQISHAVTYDTSEHEPRTLVGIAVAMIRNPPRNLDYENRVAWQLFQANKLTLRQAFKSLVVSKDGRVDEWKTFLKIRERIVPRKLRLSFYDKAPPGPWPSIIYRTGRGGFPVRDISFEEALGFAHWDGRHIPSEFEWEYAARGPRGLDFPWGAHAAKLEEHANGGQVFGRDERPLTVPVTNFASGVSWIGCWNLLGNVEEWTSSWLLPYPDALQSPSPPPGRNLVVRGGSAAHEDPLRLRTAYRGWQREESRFLPHEELGPMPDTRRRWTGFRTARYEEPGESRTVGMHYFVQRGRQMERELLEPDIFEAWQGLQVNNFPRDAGDLLTRPGYKSVVVQPLQQVAVRFAGDSIHHANTNPDLKDLLSLHELSMTQPVLIGLFQTDLHLEDLWSFSRPGSSRLERARCPPGTWYVALFRNRLCLLAPDFGAVYFVTNRPAPKSVVNVRTVRSRNGDQPAIPTATMSYNPGRESLRAAYQTQLSLQGSTTYLVNVDMRLTLTEIEAAAVRNWEHGQRRGRRPER